MAQQPKAFIQPINERFDVQVIEGQITLPGKDKQTNSPVLVHLYKTNEYIPQAFNHPYVQPILAKVETTIQNVKYVAIITPYYEKNVRQFSAQRQVCNKWFKQVTEVVAFFHNQNMPVQTIQMEDLVLDAQNNVIFESTALVPNEHPEPVEGQIPPHFFVAPEVIKENKLTRASDIWGLGCIYYEMITGQHPFFDEPRKAIEKVVKNVYEPLKGTAYPQIEAILPAMLNPDYTKRPKIGEVLEAIKTIQ